MHFKILFKQIITLIKRYLKNAPSFTPNEKKMTLHLITIAFGPGHVHPKLISTLPLSPSRVHTETHPVQ